MINLTTSVNIAVQVQDIRLQAGSGSGSGSSGKTGNGNGNGNGASAGNGDSSNGNLNLNCGNGISAGRGSTRGRRDRADEWVRRTRPDEVESKVNLSFLNFIRGCSIFHRQKSQKCFSRVLNGHEC